ncbi:MAG: hypothetical protein JXR97_07660 [Planctomycetes bacterium]|nr:hypothetical protein [Planctomycetota bacterium]
MIDINNGTPLRIMGVDYTHFVLPNGDDLYLTPYGLPLADHLTPDNYYSDLNWQAKNRRPLSGTSSVYYAKTKPIDGKQCEIVLKWNRMGQDIPGGTRAVDFNNAEFNTPFEEFSLVYELRNTRYESPGAIYTQKPLAIYVPNESLELDRLGRKAYRIRDKQNKHEEVQLHPQRRYAVIYQWIKGIDAYQAWKSDLITEKQLYFLAKRVKDAIERKGFIVADHKSTHIILRPQDDGTIRKDKRGRILYAYVDFELLHRTPDRETFIRSRNRKEYLKRQANRFSVKAEVPKHFYSVSIMGVNYIYRPIQSTGGALWVVGRDPELFDFFLPEKWRRTPRIKLSSHSQTYHTCSKDNVNLVWRVSRIGEIPDMDPFRPEEQRILEAGYNSPFEEFALNRYLTDKGVLTTYPRAIYMTGSLSEIRASLKDEHKYESHKNIIMPDGEPLLRADRDYILIWGF